eukprot:GFUD01012236.1.p1 GENE.GFUD01012236.1~~GFUD01012236.1.p1  ORF type:complete len:216 (-),score=28.29 GFUD01012236.1:151-750(-)
MLLVCFLACFALIEVQTAGVKICTQDNQSSCLGMEGAEVSLRLETDPTTNWRITETTGQGGVFLENLQDCQVLRTTGVAISKSSKAAGLRQSWVLEEVPGTTRFDESYFRLYNLAFQDHTEAFVLTVNLLTHVTMTGLQEDSSTQKFVIRVDHDSPSICPAPEHQSQQQSIVIRGSRNCGRGRVSSFGRCRRVFRNSGK